MMNFPKIFGSALLVYAGILTSPAMAAEECEPLKLISSMNLVPFGNLNLVPITINGTPKQLLLHTGAGISALQASAVTAMGLHAIDDSRLKMLDSRGSATELYTQVDDFGLGALHGPHMQFIVSNAAGADANLPYIGYLAGDILGQYDVEMDFTGHKLNLFSKDHCSGHVLYWKPTAFAVVPIAIQAPAADPTKLGFRSYVPRDIHIFVPVTLDGKSFQAMINTADGISTIDADTAKFQFGINADSPGAKPMGSLDGNPDHKVFEHVFSSLTFDGVTVANAHVAVVPNLFGKKDPNNSFRTDTRIGRVDDNIGAQITIGMDVLRKLHLYAAFGERKLYITAAPAPVSAAGSGRPTLAHLDELIAASPNNAELLNTRCFLRALAKVNLDGALADCEMSLKAKPDSSHIIDSKGFVLYQLGRYQDALDSYNQALKISPGLAASLYMRGHAKQKLGDAEGGAADIAAAKAIDAKVVTGFEAAGISEN